MTQVGLRYNELVKPGAKEAALQSFINFYIHQYRGKSLEIMGAKTSNKVMSTINEYLKENEYLDDEELAKASENFSKPSYEELLDTITDVKFTQEGQPQVPWETLWQKEEEKLPTED